MKSLQTGQWDKTGLLTSPETTPSASTCYSNHLTSFGSFVISLPDTVIRTDLKVGKLQYATSSDLIHYKFCYLHQQIAHNVIPWPLQI